MIYRDGPEAYHAAAGVKMESQVEPQFFVGMNRALSNTKKVCYSLTREANERPVAIFKVTF